jgi:hippurate hydrolase
LEWARSRYPIGETEACYIAEDFSEYQQRVPGVFFFLGTGGEPLHSPKFDFDESVLDTGLALFRSLL